MLDVAILEQLARPLPAVVIGPRPLTLEDVFARVVADGWAPRRPAFGAELDRLEASHVRGHCIAPLAVDGDTLFIDPTGSPLPGDLVTFALSERGAAAQNSALPEGQSPARKGDRWAKLYLPYRGFDMLLDRHGNSATATLLSCERPDDTPVLHPARNILRGGRLLFTPDTYASGLGLNAATITDVAHATPSGVSLTGVSGVTTLNPTMTMTNSPGFDCTAIVTMNITARQSTGTVGDVSLLVQFADDNVTKVNSTATYKVLSSSDQQYTLQWEFSHLGTNAGLGKVWAAANPGSTSDTLVYGPCTLQVEYVVR